MKKASNKKTAFCRIAAVLLWLFVWQAAAMALSQPLLLSSPLGVIGRLFALLKEKTFYRAVVFTFSRIALGAGLGLILGVLLAFIAARVRAVEFLLQPLILTVRTVPVASFIILALMFLSSRELSVFISFLMVLPIVYANLLQGLLSIPRDMQEMAKMYRLSPLRRLLLVDLPHVKPHLLWALPRRWAWHGNRASPPRSSAFPWGLSAKTCIRARYISRPPRCTPGRRSLCF